MEMLAGLRTIFRERGVMRYAPATEAWAAAGPPSDPRTPTVRPREHPGRKESSS